VGLGSTLRGLDHHALHLDPGARLQLPVEIDEGVAISIVGAGHDRAPRPGLHDLTTAQDASALVGHVEELGHREGGEVGVEDDEAVELVPGGPLGNLDGGLEPPPLVGEEEGPEISGRKSTRRVIADRRTAFAAKLRKKTAPETASAEPETATAVAEPEEAPESPEEPPAQPAAEEDAGEEKKED